MTLNGTISDSFRGPVWMTSNLVGSFAKAFNQVTNPSSTAWPTANLALLIPFRVSAPTTFVEMFFFSGTSPGTTNFDLGIYREDFTRIASLGSTAAVNTTQAVQPAAGGAFATPVTLTKGRYYMAMNSAATTLTVMSWTYASPWCRAIGMQQMAVGAVALPTTITPASVGTLAVVPQFGMVTVNNIL